jgi:hypothetical protein
MYRCAVAGGTRHPLRVESYPCPACGGVADDNGCRSCGRPHDPVAAALAKLNQALSGLDGQAKRLAAGQAEVDARRQRLLAQRSALTNAIARRLAEEEAGKPARRRRRAIGAAPDASPDLSGKTAAESALSRDISGKTPAEGPYYPDISGGWPGEGGGGAGVDRPRVPRQRGPWADLPQLDPASDPDEPGGPGVETTTESAQTTLLSLGGILLAVASIAFTIVAFTAAETGARASILALMTTVALAAPVALARRGLTSTAETISAVGLLLVLLDGYAAYAGDLAGVRAMPAERYTAVLCGLTVAVAAAYRFATHLVAPQYAALVAAQPILPLLALDGGAGRTGFATAFALVAALNLGFTRVFQDVRLRRAPWWLAAAALAVATASAGLELVLTSTVGGAVRAGLALILTAAVAVAGARLTGRVPLLHIATGAATLVVILSVTKVDTLVWPEFTLVLTAALAAAIALLAQVLPDEARLGPRLASLAAAGFIAIVVTVEAAGAATATVTAALPVWSADLVGYAGKTAVTSWQVPTAAALLGIVAAAAIPARWRVDALVAGAFLFTLSVPGTGAVAYWAVPLLDVVAAAGAAVASGRIRPAPHRACPFRMSRARAPRSSAAAGSS